MVKKKNTYIFFYKKQLHTHSPEEVLPLDEKNVDLSVSPSPSLEQTEVDKR
jgi:hypothetical protein